MSITYGGQELVQPSAAVLEWAERMLDVGGAWDTPPHIPRGGAALQRLPYVPTAPTDEPGVNILCWPRGASRYAYGHFVVHETQLAIIRTAVSAGGTYNALQFIFSDGVQTVSPYLYMLPPKPVAAPDPSNSLPGLYLITLVDERYLWWCKGVAGTALDVTSWATLYASLGTALGVTITADAVHSDYGTPPDSFAIGYQSLPVLLDACAASCGQMIVRTLEGDVLALNAASSETRLESNVAAWGRLAGGSVADQLVDRTSVVPSSVAVCFGRLDAPGEPYAKENTLASLAIATYSGVTAFSGKKILYHPTRADYTGGGGTPANQAALDLIAARMATDWYGFRFGRFEARLEGAAAWQMEGHTDRVYFDHSRDAIATCGVTTRVAPPPWLEPTSDCGEDPSEGRFIEGGDITWVDVTVNWTDIIFNWTDISIDIDNLVINVTGGPLIVNGPNYFTVNGPFEICGWMFWCHTTHEIDSQEDDWDIPATLDDPDIEDDIHGQSIVLRLVLDGPSSITGMIPAGDGQVVVLVNTSEDSDLTILHEDASSTDIYRFLLEDEEDVVIGWHGMRMFWYDPESARWRGLGGAGASGGGGGGGGGGIANTAEQGVGGDYDVTSSWANVTDAFVSLPAAGTYYVAAKGYATLVAGMSGAASMSLRLYGASLATPELAGSDTVVITTGTAGEENFGVHAVVVADAASTVYLQAMMNANDHTGRVETANVCYIRVS